MGVFPKEEELKKLLPWSEDLPESSAASWAVRFAANLVCPQHIKIRDELEKVAAELLEK